jgi:hypothetical protein
MAVALIDRILRLPPGDTTAFTALSLIKTYANFAAGLCVHLRGPGHQGYATIGLGSSDDPLSIKTLSLSAAEPSLIGTVQDLSLPGLDAGLRVWAYALDELEPTDNAVLLVEDGDYPLPLADLTAIFRACRKAFAPPVRTAPATAGNADLATFLRERFAHNGEQTQSLAILDQDPLVAAAGAFPERAASAIGALGSVFPLSSRRALVFFIQPRDTELLVRQLTKSLGAQVVLSFEAPNADSALDAIGSLTGHD